MVTCLRDMVVQCSHKGCASDHPLFDWIKITFQQMEPMPDTAQVAKNLRLDRPWLRGKSNIIVLLKEYNKWFFTTLCYRSLSCLAFIREASYCRRQELTDITTEQCTESKRLWKSQFKACLYQVKSFLTGFRKPCCRGGGKTVRARGGRWTQGNRVFRRSRPDTYMNSQSLAACTEPAKVEVRWDPNVKKE